MKKQFPWFEVVLIVVFMSIQIYAALSDGYNFPNTWFSRDDAYYYFKVAQNISEGHGSTFDGIHPTNGYHPLWMLICIPIFALARFDLILPLRILLIIMSGLALATAILLYRLLKQMLSIPVAMLAAVYWVFDFYVQIVFYRPGLESGIGLFFIVLLLYQLYGLERSWRKTKPRAAQIALLGVSAGLAILGRLDLIFFCAIAGIWIVFRESPIRYLLPFDILAILISVLGAFIWRLGLPEFYGSSSAVMATIIASLLINIPVFYFSGLYQQARSWDLIKIFKRTALACALSNIILLAFVLIADHLRLLDFSPYLLAANGLFAFVSVLWIRLAAYGLRIRGEATQPLKPLEHLRKGWGGWIKDGSLYYGIMSGMLAIYMVWSKLAFGIFSPVSGQIKRWWASPAINVYGGQAGSLPGFFGLNVGDFNAWQPLTGYANQWYWYIFQNFSWAYPLEVRHKIYPTLLVFLVIAIGIILFVGYRGTVAKGAQLSAIPLFIGSWLQIISYSTTGYSSPKDWYWLTEQILFLMIAALVIDQVYKSLLKRWRGASTVLWMITALYSLSSIFQYSRDVSARMPHGMSASSRPYMDVVPFIEALTHPGDVIGMTGGGNVGYFIHNRTIVNMDGLINSYEYFQALKNGTSADYLYNTGTRFVFANPDILNSLPYRGQYTNRLQPIIDWGGKDLMRLLPKPAQ